MRPQHDDDDDYVNGEASAGVDGHERVTGYADGGRCLNSCST